MNQNGAANSGVKIGFVLEVLISPPCSHIGNGSFHKGKQKSDMYFTFAYVLELK